MGVIAEDVRTYVVNLRRRPDRRAHIDSLLPPNWQRVYTSDWAEPRIDGHELDIDYLRRRGFGLFDWQIDSDNPWWSRPLKWGEVGCSIAHLACWRDAAERDPAFVMVLEDDAVPVTGFTDLLLTGLNALASEPRFEIVYLGRYPLEPDQPASSGFVTPGYSHCTFGYVLSRCGLRAVLEADLGSAIIPVDEFLPALYVDHPRRDVRRRFPRRFSALAFDPPLVVQRGKDKAGSDTEASTFVGDHR